MICFTPKNVIIGPGMMPEATYAGMSAVQKQPSETLNQNRISYWDIDSDL
jgi:hypothetical protein